MSETAKGFESLDLSKEILDAVAQMGFTEMTPIQEKTIPVMMDGHDVIALAPTGTGKTCAFGIPMLEYIALDRENIQELVLAPTRELALQIAEELKKLARYIPQIKVSVLYGGQPVRQQTAQVKRKPQIVVATPGRLLDLMRRGIVSLKGVHTLVLDEADEMLQMGFITDVCKIIDAIPAGRQFVMFSATTSNDVMTISWKYQHDPVQITVRAENENKPKITQYVIKTEREKKYENLLYLLDADVYQRVMVFTNTKIMAQTIFRRLEKEGYDAKALHGDIPQKERSRVMNGFKQGQFPILVCTDVAARGIDVDDVEAVINYDLPNENAYYTHRIGRTGRAKKHGVSITLLTFGDSIRFDEIVRFIRESPEELTFDGMGTLRRADGTAFFENV